MKATHLTWQCRLGQTGLTMTFGLRFVLITWKRRLIVYWSWYLERWRMEKKTSNNLSCYSLLVQSNLHPPQLSTRLWCQPLLWWHRLFYVFENMTNAVFVRIVLVMVEYILKLIFFSLSHNVWVIFISSTQTQQLGKAWAVCSRLHSFKPTMDFLSLIKLPRHWKQSYWVLPAGRTEKR